MVSSRFQRSIQVEWPAKTQETEFGVIRSRHVSEGQRRLGVSRKTDKKTPKPCQSANNGVFPFPTLDSGGMACKNTGNRVWCNSVKTRKRRAASSWSQPKKTQKKRQNRANLLIMVSSRFQRSIQVEWPAKTQETEFGVIRSRGKRRTASSWSRPKKHQKLLQGAKLG